MTQGELAHAAGISQSAIASYESRQRLHSRATFRLAAVLKVDALWLQTGRGTMLPVAQVAASDLDKNMLREALPDSWPFPGIRPSLIEALSSSHRRLLENTVLGYVNSCLEEYADAQMESRHEA